MNYFTGMRISGIHILAILILLFTTSCFSQSKTFSNPLLPAGADPWCIYKDGYYYYTHSTGINITIWKTKNIADLGTAEKKVVFTPPVSGPYSKDLWAPEIHFLMGKWYVYFAADDGDNANHRIWILENESKDPLNGEWKLKGKLTTPDDKWSIDGSAFEYKNQLYFTWSGWQGDTNGQQDIFIAKMKNPWTIAGDRSKISSPQLEWEKHGTLNDDKNPSLVLVNEGPQLLQHNDKLFLIYSASGCWTDFYALGMLTAKTDGDLMDSSTWKKSLQPVFTQSPENNVYAPGHNSFFKSPDGKEDWILYHANNEPGLGCGNKRSPRAQPFNWDKDGNPDFGIPVKERIFLKIP